MRKRERGDTPAVALTSSKRNREYWQEQRKAETVVSSGKVVLGQSVGLGLTVYGDRGKEDDDVMMKTRRNADGDDVHCYATDDV